MKYFVEHSIKSDLYDAKYSAILRLRIYRRLLKILLCIMGFVFVVFLYYIDLILPLIVAPVAFPLVIVPLVVLTKRYNRYTTQYDYLVDGDVFRVVLVRDRRIVLLDTPISTIEAIGNMQDEDYGRYSDQASIKTIRAVCNPSDKHAFLFGRCMGSKFLLLWEPNDELLLTLRRCNTRLVNNRVSR